MGLTTLLAAAALAVAPQQFVLAHRQPDGSFTEQRGSADVALTSWALVGLRAAGVQTDDRYVRAHEADITDATQLALAVLAERTPSPALADRLERAATGAAVNATAWKLIALAQARRPLPRSLARFLLRAQTPSGGWSWARGVAPDSNDTAAVVEALRAAKVGGRPIRRGLAFLARLENRDGGFELVSDRGSDAQSTAWAIQAYIAAGRRPPARAFRYLAQLKRSDGSYRYSRRYGTTPVWVTSQVLPALARRAFPLR